MKKSLIVLITFLLLLILGYFLFGNTIWENPEKIILIEDNSVLKSKIGQMLIIGFRGKEGSDDLKKIIQDLNIGGVILFDYDVPSKTYGRNIETEEQTKALVNDLKSYSPSLFISIDEEGGRVNRLKNFLEMPSAENMTEQDMERLGLKLKELGFNMNFAPVLDVNINKENPIIGLLGRSFSDDPVKVATLAETFIQKQQDIISVVKHFPGHGSSKTDSHFGLADVTLTYKQEELIPYQYLQEKGLLQAVMIAHIVNRNIDQGYPATLSPLFIQDILRDKIGFNGVVISDDLQMAAITKFYGFEEAIILAIQAGCDILILSNNQGEYIEDLPSQAFNVIYRAVEEGTISEERINESYQRIQKLKE